ncbi:hypothetical protein [Clostridium botulinum]|uniref:hypothetical protein n=1 Tax=Clostridium botulinum TaxID=1491 RepID=UPI001E371846|nr:hypothetical protein [Clostridium botulinum]MCD3223779.1 hypothetical protein [Clostridium botulinum C/D]MCD3297161.1 hypothetical protein [Clostridium botulinum C/D]
MAISSYRQATEHIMKDMIRKDNIDLCLINEDNNEIDISDLPEYPLEFLKKDNKVYKIIHVKDTDLEWSEELIRDLNGKVVQIKTTYPDMSYEIVDLIKNNENKVVKMTSKDVEVD